jgi:type IV pilus assembly protein PilN
MIRVNLLPVKEARRRSAGRIQLLIFVVVLVIECAILVFLHMVQQGKLEEVRDKVATAQKKVDKLEKEVEEAKDLEKRKKKLEQKLSVLDDIEKQSIGPVNVLEELLTILSRPKNVEQRYAQRKKDWNVEWNPRHVWIESLKESDGEFEMVGRAVDADDVAEFLHRLETATHFQNVQLDYVRPQDSDSGDVVGFRITGNIQYRKPDEENGDQKGS